ncbi:MAG: MgtC/SapB family protein [Deltaproteobacteria bacterium]|nr:MgtC/SapB family protein [Deltaproteobacteria bacterium]
MDGGSLALDPMVARDFAVALAIGGLIGVERELRKVERGGHEVGGIRTFLLFSLIGAVAAWLSRQMASPWPLALAVLGVSAMISVSYAVLHRRVSAADEDAGLTTEAAAVATTLLGALALYGYPDLAGALGILTAALLAFKRPIHGLVGRLDMQDLYAGLKLLIATFIVLPLLPDRALDPLGAINPHELWLLVVLISFLSLIGYVAVRLLGTGRGTVLTGIFGGMTSSTAVTLTFARRSVERGGENQSDALACGIVLAWGVMFLRVAIEVTIVHAPLLPALVTPLAAMLGVACAAAFVLYRRSRRVPEHPRAIDLRNPFSLTAAIKFAGVFMLVLLAVAVVQRWAPARGELVVAALAGLTDVDAITLSMATFARDGGAAATAAQAIAVATFTNTIVKCGLVVGLASRALRARLVGVTGAVVAAGTAALLLD